MIQSLSPESTAGVLAKKMQESPQKDIWEAQDIGYCLCGLNGMDISVPEVTAVVQELSLKVALSKYGSEPLPLSFLQYGKNVRVQRGGSVETQIYASNLLEKMEAFDVN